MIKEELKQEAEEFVSKNWTPYDFYDTECNVYNDDIKDDLIRVCTDFAEPREKQIQVDAEQIRALQKQNGELTDKVKKLEAQIEKMKRCFNCKYHNKFVESKCGECECYSKWEIKEND